MAAKKPLRTETHRKKRLEWCRERKDWTRQQWGTLLWSDESIFELIPTRRVFVRRRKGERYNQDCLVPTVKHGGGKIQVWGCMAASGVGTLKVVNGRLNAAGYVRLICKKMGKDCVGGGLYSNRMEPLVTQLEAQEHGLTGKELPLVLGHLRVLILTPLNIFGGS